MKRILAVFLACLSINAIAQESKSAEKIIEAIQTGKLVSGSHAFFSEFFENEPSIRDTIEINAVRRHNSPWEGTQEVNPRYGSTGKKLKRVWGFSDGTKAYVWHQVEYFPIEVENNELVFYAYDLIEDDGAVAAGAIGGAIGGGIYAASQLSKAKKQRIRYKIELISGAAMHPQHGFSTRKIPEIERDLVVYRRKKREMEAAATFVVNDSLKYSFEPNSNVRLRFPQNVKNVKVCAGADFKQCVHRELENGETSYVKVKLLEDQEQAEAVDVLKSEGEFDYYKTMKHQDKRGSQKAERIELR